MKNFSLVITLIVLGVISVANAGAEYMNSEISDYIRNSDGTVNTRFNEYHADEACKKLNARLPTAREIAKEAERNGQGKFLEESEINNTPVGFGRSDFALYISKGAGGAKDNFYFSTNKYIRPGGDLGTYAVWTSSEFPGGDTGRVNVFIPTRGYFLAFSRNFYGKFGVRCIFDKITP